MKKKLLTILLFSFISINLTACGGGIFELAGYANTMYENGNILGEEEFVFDMPYGFEYSEEDEMYVSPDGYAGMFYEKEFGTIGLTDSESDKKLVEDMLKLMLGLSYDEEIDIEIIEWEETIVDGHQALYYVAEVEYSGVNITFMQYMVQGTFSTHNLYFSEIGELYYWDQFEECIESIRFE